MKKKILSLLLALALCLTLLPTAALAVDGSAGDPAQEADKPVSVSEQSQEKEAAVENGISLLSTENRHNDSHPICGASCSDGTHASLPAGTMWQPIKTEKELREKTKTAGYYYLANSITLNVKYSSSDLWEPVSGVVLCLNGYDITLKGDGNFVAIFLGNLNTSAAVDFTLTDCHAGTAEDPQGKIKHDDPSQGAGVQILPNCTFTMYGGRIVDNGGGVTVAGGTFNMYGGMISNNTAYGGVRVTYSQDHQKNDAYVGGTFNMYNGIISGNKANYGGGVFVDSDSSRSVAAAFRMYGGSITDNSANTLGYGTGGGVYVDSSACTFEISGNANITGNTKTGFYSNADTPNNVYLPDGAKMTVGTLGSKASIGVTTETAPTERQPVTIAENVGTDYSSKVTSDDGAYEVKFKSNSLVLQLKPPAHAHYLCGGTTCVCPEDHKETGTVITFTEWTDTLAEAQNGAGSTAANSLPKDSGVYYLSTNVELTDSWKPANGTVLDLCGHDITKNSEYSTIWFNSNVKFTLVDCKGGNKDADYGKITHGSKDDGTKYTGSGVDAGNLNASFTMYGGNITGNNKADGSGGGVYLSAYGGSFTMYGGEITGNTASVNGGGVYLDANSNASPSVFNMYGGTISNNKAATEDRFSTSNGGGVYAKGSFNMYGGTISGNETQKGNGGGVYAKGAFTMSGSKSLVTGNTAWNGGGVYAESSFTMTDSTISKNTATRDTNVGDGDGGGVYTKGSFTMSGGTISENEANGCGAGVYVADAGSFTMENNSTISKNRAESTNNKTNYGGGVYADGKFTMKNGTISDNTAKYGGGAYVWKDLTMENGTISNNTATFGSGGGVHAREDFTIENGKITGNTAKNEYGAGGGVYAGGDFTMEKGEISNNTAEGERGSQNYTVYGGGGGVYTVGKFEMSDGTISGNRATYGMDSGFGGGNGGGVFVESKSFTMTGGTISGNMAASNGGGVCANGDFTMTNGTISGNRAISGNGGGVWADNSQKVKVSGNIQVTGNFKGGTKAEGSTAYTGGTANNFFVDPDSSYSDAVGAIQNAGLTGNAKIGISVAQIVLNYLNPGHSTDAVVTKAQNSDLKYFSVDAGEPYELKFVPDTADPTTGTIVIFKPAEHEHEWTYARKEGTQDTIVATCKDTDGKCPDTDGGSVTIKAPEEDKLVYDKNVKRATLDSTLDASISTPDITYTKKDDSSFTGNPTDAGEYTASITLGDATASVTYSIRKNDRPDYSSLPAQSASYGQTLADITLPDSRWSWVDDTQSVGDVGSRTFEAIFTPTNTNYNSVTVDVTVTVSKAAGGTLTPASYSVKYTDREPHTHTVTGLPSGQNWSYSSELENSTLVSVLASHEIGADTGVLTYTLSDQAAAGQILTFVITASCKNYNDFTQKVVVTLTDKAAQTLTFAPSTVNKTYGDAKFTFAASNDRKDGGSITYTSSDLTVATVDSATGEVTILKAGTAVITAKAAATDDYAVGTASYTLTVGKATITITAKDQTAYVGDQAPVLGEDSYTVSGLVNGEVLKTEPTVDYASTPDMTKAGEVAIQVSGAAAPDGDNYYDIRYVEGNLTIANRPSSGGGSYVPTYPVSTPDKVENGTVSASPKNASKGSIVTITVKPDDGFQLGDLTVTDKDGNKLEITSKGDGKYSFVMPASKVDVSASFIRADETSPFKDVATDAYYYEAVKWAAKNGITGGVGNGLFAPDQTCTRAQIVTFLWRAAGSPEPKGMSSFTDVAPDAYYAKAVAWAVENGITTGTSADKFSPDAPCTRAQSVTFLFRAVKASASGVPAFRDVAATAYYAEAVKWATDNGVTEGVGNGLFGPDNDCTRAQIVTFLWRLYAGK